MWTKSFGSQVASVGKAAEAGDEHIAALPTLLASDVKGLDEDMFFRDNFFEHVHPLRTGPHQG